jgi:hypothetical protein
MSVALELTAISPCVGLTRGKRNGEIELLPITTKRSLPSPIISVTEQLVQLLHSSLHHFGFAQRLSKRHVRELRFARLDFE